MYFLFLRSQTRLETLTNAPSLYVSIPLRFFDSSILPQGSPENLKSIRVVMVGKITASDVSLRYPSMFSLRSHFDYSRMNRNKPLKKRSGGGLLPVFNESHVMASEKAGDLLYRRIAPQEISMFPFSILNPSIASVLLNHPQSLSVGSHGFRSNFVLSFRLD